MILKTDADGRYCLAEPITGIECRADHLRRDAKTGELFGELTVSAGLLGSRAVDGVLAFGSFNYSSIPARSRHAKFLSERARSGNKIDFLALLEAFAQYIARQERFGPAAVTLRDVELRPATNRSIDVLGLRFPVDHLSMIFGAGDTLKSYLALYIATEHAKQGGRVLYIDWELDAEDHRQRLGAICGADMPEFLRYAHCDRPLVHEVDRLRRIIRADQTTFAILDSVAYGTLGDPAEAASAMEFCRAAGQLGVGKIALAHITKLGDQNDRMPYGSVFWHNSARMTWNVKKADPGERGDVILGCFNRKSNLGPSRPAVGIAATFADGGVTFARIDLAKVAELAEHLPLPQRICQVLRGGPRTVAQIQEELYLDNVETLERTIRRGVSKDQFLRLESPDGSPPRIALVERRSA